MTLHWQIVIKYLSFFLLENDEAVELSNNHTFFYYLPWALPLVKIRSCAFLIVSMSVSSFKAVNLFCAFFLYSFVLFFIFFYILGYFNGPYSKYPPSPITRWGLCLRLSCCSLAKGSHVLRRFMLCYYISSDFGLSGRNSILEKEKEKKGEKKRKVAVGIDEAGADVQPSEAIWYLCPH